MEDVQAWTVNMRACKDTGELLLSLSSFLLYCSRWGAATGFQERCLVSSFRTVEYSVQGTAQVKTLLHTPYWQLESRVRFSATTSQIELQNYFLEVTAVLQNEWTEGRGLQWESSEKQLCRDRVLPHVRSCHFRGNSWDTWTDRSLWVWFLHHIFCVLLIPLGLQGWHQLEQILYHKKGGLVWWDSRRTLHICSTMDIPLWDGACLSVILALHCQSLFQFDYTCGLYITYIMQLVKLEMVLVENLNWWSLKWLCLLSTLLPRWWGSHYL